LYRAFVDVEIKVVEVASPITKALPINSVEVEATVPSLIFPFTCNSPVVVE
jgi:hypothetical protein